MSSSQHVSLDFLIAFLRPTTIISISSGSNTVVHSSAISRSIGLLRTGLANTRHTLTNLTLRQAVFIVVGASSVFYVLSPTLVDCFLYLTGGNDDDDNNTNSKKKKKNRSKMMLVRRKKKAGKYTVGLVNPANDCFANSNLQALASLRLLYGYISALELAAPPDAVNLNGIDEPSMSSASSTTSSAPANDNKPTPRSSIKSNPKGIETSLIGLTLALGKTILALNEPVLTPKSLSPWPFLRVIEAFYNSHISRNQHDAHELLHLILESLETEHERVSKFNAAQKQQQQNQNDGSKVTEAALPMPEFPFKGTTIDKITCSKCGYSPTTSSSTFIVFSLMVPQKKSAHLTDLLNEVSSPEYIKDYGCVRCRVNHVIATASATGQDREFAAALAPYAENRLLELPDELEARLPRSITSPISKSMQFGRLPAILAIHLSRSIYGGYGASRNSCKVTVVETIELWENIDDSPSTGAASGKAKPAKEMKSAIEMAAQLLGNRRKVTYRLVAMIRHKGTHHAGHYECFRRKNLEWWIDHLPKAKPTAPINTTANNNSSSSISSTRSNNEGGTNSGKISSVKASTFENAASSNTDPKSTPPLPAAVANKSFQSGSTITSSQTGNASTEPAAPTTPKDATPTIASTPKAVAPLDTAAAVPATQHETIKPTSALQEQQKPQQSPQKPARRVLAGDEEENHDKLPFPQANRTTPLATSKIDVTTPKQQLAYSSSSSSVVSLVAQAQQAQQQMEQQQKQQPQMHQYPQPTSSPPGSSSSVISRYFGTEVSPPSQYEWWKISDEKTWECSTRDVLKEESGAYLLFYERV
jgi:ubiquitin C-terminal hydrolase